MQLIDQYTVAARAEALGLAVSEMEVTRYIVKKGENPDFMDYAKRDATFDYERWVDWVHQALGTTPDDYRKLVGRELLIEQRDDRDATVLVRPAKARPKAALGELSVQPIPEHLCPVHHPSLARVCGHDVVFLPAPFLRCLIQAARTRAAPNGRTGQRPRRTDDSAPTAPANDDG
jgi:hypothetical protein